MTAAGSPQLADRASARITSVLGLCAALTCILLGRAAWIQLDPNPRLEQLSRRQFNAKVLIQPRRGEILDRDGEPLAINTETRSLAMNPSRLSYSQGRALARLLSRALDIPYSRLLRKVSAKKHDFEWVKRHMTDAELDRLRKFRVIERDGDLAQGLWIVNESERVYPHNELAAHLIGQVNLDSTGTEGVEYWQDERLRGKVISMNAIKDALGRPAFIDSSAATAAEEGRDGEPVTLTIDASLQFAVEERLREAVRKASARAGTVIVMNAVTGEILAMANQPTFNPNFHGDPPDHHRNRALTDGYEPGSTMKPVLLACALSNGMRLTDEIWAENGHLKVQGRTISEAETHERFKWLSLKRIIQVSSNVGAAKLALKLGADKYLATLKAFGFGARTGTGFPGEAPGRVPPRKAWQPITLADAGFGQGVLVTPMQMTRAYAAFLNGGWLVQPTLIQSLRVRPTPPRRILSEKITARILEALQSVTDTREGGTGGEAVLEGYRVAGKTGTAQKVDPLTHAYSRTKHVASFIGFALGVDPKIVIFASIDEPRGDYYGGSVAAPLFREVLSAVATRFSLPRDATLLADDAIHVTSAHPAPMLLAPAPPAPDAGLELVSQPLDPKLAWRMPSLRGLTSREVVEALQGHSLRLEIRGEGLVRSQYPEEGRAVAEGDTVRIVLGEARGY